MKNMEKTEFFLRGKDTYLIIEPTKQFQNTSWKKTTQTALCALKPQAFRGYFRERINLKKRVSYQLTTRSKKLEQGRPFRLDHILVYVL